jgi:hypothetical protein
MKIGLNPNLVLTTKTGWFLQSDLDNRTQAQSTQLILS